MTGGSQRSIGRRDFVKAAVAIGGSSALAACLDREADAEFPRGSSDRTTLPERQHAWNDVLGTDDHGNVDVPFHHVVLLLDYAGEGTPTADERETVESALQSLERTYARGNEGLLFTVGYTPAYFDRFDTTLPDSVDLPEPRALSNFEEPALDRPDAAIHLTSDHGSVVLAAEEALRGNRDTVNGVEMDAALSGVLTDANLDDGGPARRTGFVGKGLPAENQDVEGVPDDEPVPEDSPLYMGFKSGFEKGQASEDFVTISEGPFADGTTQHLSWLRLRLEDWYGEQDHEDRVAEMFCPFHAENDLVDGTGENLGTSPGLDENDCPSSVEDDARSYGRIGHAQKTASAREDGDPLILRRDFDSTDDDEAGLHFLSLQERITDFETTREAMNGAEHTDQPAIRQRVNNGILEYTFVRRRGNYLVPPREKRALPTPR